MKLADIFFVSIFVVLLAMLIALSFFDLWYGLMGIGLLLVVFGLLLLLIRRANRPTSAQIAAMRIKH
ncbi:MULTISPECIES: hypothetical protein [Roseobacteraceae]|uniref:hypothetical protein n=1 Tax=Roseobacteraceae TaxID=2854170 RepID=UPI00080AAA5B|nr:MULTISPECIES: hypothetical protein [Roseobacteraceae]ANT63569.1 hypothetical protein AYJ57_24190 [Salipiger sp. CCB-MM3]MCA0997260.1 hypothetical protein [Alloyangia pacifica]NDW01284.1 hypothetical protein [Salipiger sp. PrR002]NDW58072.1 hypothetical protein [Salipiger sp. PrR004]